MREPSAVPFVLRDGSFAIATALAWWLLLGKGGASGPGIVALNVIVGLMTVLLGYLVHEWGHLIGCWSRNAVVKMPERITAVFLFNFDVGCNTHRQFNAMVAGGFIASLVFVLAAALFLPLHLLAGKIALALTVIGVIATFVLEVPTAWRVFRGGALPQQGPAFVSTRGQTT